MIYDKCRKNGHKKTRCRRKAVWRNCGKEDHTSDKTNHCPNEAKCVNCGERHMAGSNNCEVEKKINKKMQADSSVGRRRALQILAGGGESPRSNPQSYPTHFRCKIYIEKKTTFNPWAIKQSFTEEIGSKPAYRRSNYESVFRNLKRKSKQSSFSHNVTMFTTIPRKGQSWNIRVRQKQPKPRPDLHLRL